MINRRAATVGALLMGLGAGREWKVNARASTPSPAQAALGPALAKLQRYAGPMLPVSDVIAMGGDSALYERRFKTYSDKHWLANKANWEADYYNCGAIEYVWWARTGEQAYYDRARAKALDYRTRYIEANNYGASAHWAMMPSMFYDSLVTGEEKSIEALSKVTSTLLAPYYMNSVADPGNTDNRIQARMLTGCIYSTLCGVKTAPPVPNIQANGADWGLPGGWDLRVTGKEILMKVMSTQKPDGSYMYSNGSPSQFFNKPFMVALLNFAMTEYHDYLEQDTRILSAVQKSCDYMWDHQWLPAKMCWPYPGGGNVEKSAPAPDLNGLMLANWGWLYKNTGEPKYRAQGQQILRGAMAGAYLAGAKQFNQTYLESYRWFAYA